MAELPEAPPITIAILPNFDKVLSGSLCVMRDFCVNLSFYTVYQMVIKNKEYMKFCRTGRLCVMWDFCDNLSFYTDCQMVIKNNEYVYEILLNRQTVCGNKKKGILYEILTNWQTVCNVRFLC